MPLSTDETVNKTAADIVAQLHAIFGEHPGFRPAHAKGIILTGTFTPTAEAKNLSIAPHFSNPSTPVWARFSNSTGLPTIPDTIPPASPRGLGLRFNLSPHVHTDIITHSTPFFPSRTGSDFLSLFHAIGTSPPGGPSPSPLDTYLASHPKALAFIQAPKPTPSSYAREAYWGVNAYILVDASGKRTSIRYRFTPVAGVEVLDSSLLSSASPDFLLDELTTRLQKEKIGFKLLAQIAQDGDITDDSTIQWDEDRDLVTLGVVELDGVLDDYEKEAKNLILDPIPRVEGVEPSEDPLLEMRAAVYLISGRERRAA